MISFEQLFEPRGIAVVGASPELSRPGAQTVRALSHFGYRGRVYPVNPKYPTISGYKCYPTLEAIDGDCDVAVVALAARLVPDVIAQCGGRNIPYAVVLSAGFRESGGAGARIEAQ